MRHKKEPFTKCPKYDYRGLKPQGVCLGFVNCSQPVSDRVSTASTRTTGSLENKSEREGKKISSNRFERDLMGFDRNHHPISFTHCHKIKLNSNHSLNQRSIKKTDKKQSAHSRSITFPPDESNRIIPATHFCSACERIAHHH